VDPGQGTKNIEMKPSSVETSSDGKIIITFVSDILAMSGLQFSRSLISINILYALSSDYFNSSNLYSNLTSSSNNYGLTTTQIEEVISKLKLWMNTISENYNITDRPVPLTYSVNFADNENMPINTYVESIMRRGNDTNLNIQYQLSERSFWFYFVKEKIVNEIYQNDIENKWTYIENLVKDLYPLVKPIFVNNILDNNHNITNFSLNNEIPVVRLNLTYDYK
jgi:hypothetical protein